MLRKWSYTVILNSMLFKKFFTSDVKSLPAKKWLGYFSLVIFGVSWLVSVSPKYSETSLMLEAGAILYSLMAFYLPFLMKDYSKFLRKNDEVDFTQLVRLSILCFPLVGLALMGLLTFLAWPWRNFSDIPYFAIGFGSLLVSAHSIKGLELYLKSRAQVVMYYVLGVSVFGLAFSPLAEITWVVFGFRFVYYNSVTYMSSKRVSDYFLKKYGR